MLIFDAAVGIALFALLRPLGRNIAVLSTAFRLLHTAIHGTTLIVLLVAVELLDGGAALAGLGGEERNALALAFLNAQAYGYLIGLIFFGVHVGVLGYAAVWFGFIPKTIGWLLLVASAGYITDGFARVLLSNYAEYETAFALIVFVPVVIGELTLGLWLLFKGTNSAALAPNNQRMPGTRLATGS